MTELTKSRLCCEWLNYCLSIGWKRSELDGLQDVFMKHEGWKTFKGWRRQ